VLVYMLFIEFMIGSNHLNKYQFMNVIGSYRVLSTDHNLQSIIYKLRERASISIDSCYTIVCDNLN
jgi:hypothetical protein